MIDYDPIHRQENWRFVLHNVTTYAYGDRNIYYLRVIHVPAVGLADAYIRYTVSSFNLLSGQENWIVRLEDWVPKSDRTDDADGFDVDEDCPHAVVVAACRAILTLNGTTALQESTGRILWQSPKSYGDGNTRYVAGGLVEADEASPSNPTDYDEVGLDPRSGRVIWHLNFPAWFDEAGGIDTRHIVGAFELDENSSGVVENDVLTGKTIFAQRLPSAWSALAYTPTLLAVYTHGELELFRLGKAFGRPIWAVPSGSDVSVLALSSKHLLISAQSGYLVLSSADGKETPSDTSGLDSPPLEQIRLT